MNAQQTIDMHNSCADAGYVIHDICDYAKSINAYVKVNKSKPEKVVWRDINTYNVYILTDSICKFVDYNRARTVTYNRKVHDGLAKKYVILNDKAYLIVDKQVVQIDIDCITIDLCIVDDRLYAFKMKLLNRITFPESNLISTVGLSDVDAIAKIIDSINIFLHNKFHFHATQLAAVFSLMSKVSKGGQTNG